MNWKRVASGILRIAGLKIWIASLVPMFVATTLAYIKTGMVDYKWGLISVLGIMLIETGKHCLNDIVDYKSGVDLSVEPDHVTPFSGGKKVLTENLLTLKEAKNIGIIMLTMAAAIGIVIAVFREPWILFIGTAGIFIACAYSVPPFSFCYRGLGEIAVGVTYGPLILLGMYMVLTGRVEAMALLLSVPLGLLVVNILWINQYPDYEADLKNNKRNWLVRLGKKKGLSVYRNLYLLVYLFYPVMAAATGNLLWMINWITVPLAYQSYQIACSHYDNISRLVKANQLTARIYGITGMSLAVTLVLTKLIFIG